MHLSFLLGKSNAKISSGLGVSITDVKDEKMPAFLQRRPAIRTLLVISLIYSFFLSAAYLSFVIKIRPGGTWSSNPTESPGANLEKLLQLKKAGQMLDIVKGSADRRRAPRGQQYSRTKIHWGYQNLLEGKPLQMQCTKCAVVSSSGHLINSGAGREIDETPCVFRMNNAPVTGYEVDVGSRTTVRSLGHVNLEKSFDDNEGARMEMLIDNRTRADIILINWMSKTKLKKLVSKEYRFAVLLAHLFPAVKFYIFTLEKMRSSEALFKNQTGLSRREAQTWLSTGWYTLLAAMDICTEIVVYGMADENYCASSVEEAQSIPYHYYEPDKLKECSYYNQSEIRLNSGHLFITEKAVFARWAVRHNIKFKHPSWPERDIGRVANLETPFLKRYRENKRYQAEHRKRRLVPRMDNNAVQLRMGNKTFTVDKEHLVDKIIELQPDTKVLLGSGNDLNVKTNITGDGS